MSKHPSLQLCKVLDLRQKDTQDFLNNLKEVFTTFLQQKQQLEEQHRSKRLQLSQQYEQSLRRKTITIEQLSVAISSLNVVLKATREELQRAKESLRCRDWEVGQLRRELEEGVKEVQRLRERLRGYEGISRNEEKEQTLIVQESKVVGQQPEIDGFQIHLPLHSSTQKLLNKYNSSNFYSSSQDLSLGRLYSSKQNITITIKPSAAVLPSSSSSPHPHPHTSLSKQNIINKPLATPNPRKNAVSFIRKPQLQQSENKPINRSLSQNQTRKKFDKRIKKISQICA